MTSFCVLRSVSDDDIYNAFGSIFGIYGDDVVEKIEYDGMKKIVHIYHKTYENYNASNSSEYNVYHEFDNIKIVMFTLWWMDDNGKEHWCYGDGTIGPRFSIHGKTIGKRFNVCYAD